MTDRARILVVDDDESIRKVFSAILQEQEYIVDTASDGEEAIRKSHASFYNLALVDIRLPDMEGTELLPKLRETTPRMVKIIVTGFPSLQNAIAAVNKEADAYLIKPVKIDELLETIQLHLSLQDEEKRYSERRITEFVETRIAELEQLKQTRSRN